MKHVDEHVLGLHKLGNKLGDGHKLGRKLWHELGRELWHKLMVPYSYEGPWKRVSWFLWACKAKQG